MRVLQVMECTIGGTRRHLRDLVHGLLRRGVDVDVACATLRDPDGMRRDLCAMAEAGARVHEIPMVRPIRPLTDAVHAARLAALCARGRFDVAHTHSSKAGALGRTAAWLLRVPVRVHTPHTFAFAFDGAGQGGDRPGPRGLLLATERTLGRLTQGVVHVSDSELAEGERLGVVARERTRVIPNGIDARGFGGATAADVAALRRSLGVPDGAPIVGSVGLLNDAKGHDLLVEAAAHLPAAAHVVIAGHGELEASLRTRADALGLGGRFHLLGWRDDLPVVYAACEVFVLPSRWEGLPYALLEALAAGCACVATDVNGSRDILGYDPVPDPARGPAALRAGTRRPGAPEVGVLVPREDPAAIGAAVTALLADEPHRRALGEAGRALVEHDYDVETMVDRTLGYYRDLLEARR